MKEWNETVNIWKAGLLPEKVLTEGVLYGKIHFGHNDHKGHNADYNNYPL